MTFYRTRLPYLERPDLSPFLVHLTKAGDGCTAYDNLINIIESGTIRGSDNSAGYIKGPYPATSFMDIPLSSLKYVLNTINTKSPSPRYGPCGIVISKEDAYSQGARPVLYLSNPEINEMGITDDHLWRVVIFEGVINGSIGWLHEREWRIKGDYSLTQPLAVLVKDCNQAKRLNRKINSSPRSFTSIPQSIIPLDILCQGLPFL